MRTRIRANSRWASKIWPIWAHYPNRAERPSATANSESTIIPYLSQLCLVRLSTPLRLMLVPYLKPTIICLLFPVSDLSSYVMWMRIIITKPTISLDQPNLVTRPWAHSIMNPKYWNRYLKNTVQSIRMTYVFSLAFFFFTPADVISLSNTRRDSGYDQLLVQWKLYFIHAMQS